jgi:hypothetical protein
MADKCTENIGLKVPPALKALYDDLSPEIKKQAKRKIIEVIERAIYDSRYRFGMYSE